MKRLVICILVINLIIQVTLQSLTIKFKVSIPDKLLKEVLANAKLFFSNLLKLINY